MKRRLLVAAVTLGVAACAQSAPDTEAPAADTLTRRQKDSIISTLPIPGASKIGDALKAVDRANARVQQYDTMR
jgi:ABC-type glycerol-3-phosphate transport system substrate-binding protein